MKLIECSLGAVTTTVFGIEYAFQRDRYGRFVTEVHDDRHAACFLAVEHYFEVPAEPEEEKKGKGSRRKKATETEPEPQPDPEPDFEGQDETTTNSDGQDLGETEPASEDKPEEPNKTE